MYKKTVLIGTVLFISGCSEFGEKLKNAVIEGAKLSLSEKKDGGKNSDTNQKITEDEEKEKAMRECLSEHKTFFKYANRTSDRKWQIHYCDTITIREGYPSLASIAQKVKNSKRSSEETKVQMQECREKYGNYFGTKIEKFCKGFIDLNEAKQCQMDYIVRKGLSRTNAVKRCIRERKKNR